MRRTLVATVIIGLLLSATAAASSYLITNTHQIKPSVLRQLHGSRGPRGFAGAPGATGPSGLSTQSVIQVKGPAVFMCASGGGSCSVAGSYATCPAGFITLGGGWGSDSPSPNATVGDTYSIGSNNAWDVVMVNNSSLSNTSFYAVAECVGGSTAHKALAASSARDLRIQAARLLAAARMQKH
jgi:hypothetical protein